MKNSKKILIRGELVYDGSLSPPKKTDILVENGIISELGLSGKCSKPGENQAAGDVEIIEAKLVCPGFVDIHRHADVAAFASPRGPSVHQEFGKTELLQGITTTVAGNCGLSPVPGAHPWQTEYYNYLEPVVGPIPREQLESGVYGNFKNYREALEKASLPINVGFLAGAGAIKTAVKGFSSQPFSPGEMDSAKQYILEACQNGALGLSIGLIYQPERYSSLEELIEMARAASSFSPAKVLCAHIRGEGSSLVQSIEEMIQLSEGAGIPLNISHFKATGVKNWGSLIYKAIEKIEAARSRGIPITADFYPYNGGSTTILSFIPPSLMQEDMAAACAALAGKEGRDLLRRELSKDIPGWDTNPLNTGWDRIIISAVTLREHESFCGRTMEAVAREEGFEDPVDLMGELVSTEEGKVGIITLTMSPDDIDSIAKLPWTCVISDSLYSAASNPHPRLHGVFPKFLREFVRERRILSMEEAINKMTSMPAERMGLKNRGKIIPGCAADLLIFDPGEFRDNADYTNSRALSSGMGTVILNGEIVYRKGTFFTPNGRMVYNNI